MSYAVIGMLVNRRKKAAPKVQSILTEFGDCIIGRMGLPEGHGPDKEDGLITLTVRASEPCVQQLVKQLGEIEGVSVNSAIINN